MMSLHLEEDGHPMGGKKRARNYAFRIYMIWHMSFSFFRNGEKQMFILHIIWTNIEISDEKEYQVFISSFQKISLENISF